MNTLETHKKYTNYIKDQERRTINCTRNVNAVMTAYKLKDANSNGFKKK